LHNILKTVKTPTNIILNIFTNTLDVDINGDIVKHLFKEVNVINTAIKKEDDVYIMGCDNPNPPTYGWANGPNLLFMTAMEHLKKYNTTLVLETDCTLYENWLNKCIDYASIEYFLVSGSTYDGNAIYDPSDNLIISHINGVAFYKTGSPIFQHVIESLEKYIRHSVLKKFFFCSYDYSLYQMTLLYIRSEKDNVSKFWKYVLRYILKTSLIINMSPPKDKNITESQALSVHKNCAILHKKN
jgi:hypothetical protein